MRITKQRRAFIDAVKKDLEKFNTPKQLAIFYSKRYEIFEGCDSVIVPLVEIAISEFVKEKNWELEYAVNIGFLRIEGKL